MMFKDYFNNLIQSSRYSIGTTVEEVCNTDDKYVAQIKISDMGINQSYALARYINGEYPRYCGKVFDYTVGDPTMSGIATIVDDEDEAILIKIPKDEASQFDNFLTERADDISFVLENSRISKYLRAMPWGMARESMEGEMQPVAM